MLANFVLLGRGWFWQSLSTCQMYNIHGCFHHWVIYCGFIFFLLFPTRKSSILYTWPQLVYVSLCAANQSFREMGEWVDGVSGSLWDLIILTSKPKQWAENGWYCNWGKMQNVVLIPIGIGSTYTLSGLFWFINNKYIVSWRFKNKHSGWISRSHMEIIL